MNNTGTKKKNVIQIANILYLGILKEPWNGFGKSPLVILYYIMLIYTSIHNNIIEAL